MIVTLSREIRGKDKFRIDGKTQIDVSNETGEKHEIYLFYEI